MRPVYSMILLFSVVFFLAGGCKKDTKDAESYKCAACTTTPEAKAVNDASSKGFTKAL